MGVGCCVPTSQRAALPPRTNRGQPLPQLLLDGSSQAGLAPRLSKSTFLSFFFTVICGRRLHGRRRRLLKSCCAASPQHPLSVWQLLGSCAGPTFGPTKGRHSPRTLNSPGLLGAVKSEVVRIAAGDSLGVGLCSRVWLLLRRRRRR